MTAALGATYRLQLSGYGFAAATRAVPFLAGLGIETLYVSPITRARSGSPHGYDVVDPTVLDPALGSRAEFDALLAALADHDMRLLVDIVPNHMAASPENPYFADVLTHGRASRYAGWFDIAWDEQAGRVMLPVLGRPLDEAVEAGEISVARDDGVAIAYFDHRFPVDPATADIDDVRTLLDRQHYRLADWRLANTELNYRRFFDINELIGIRQEDPAVFDATHRLVVELATDPRVAGVRVDHVDGLRDPAGYLRRLRAALPATAAGTPVVIIEKILERDERLPDWPVDGTSGYEFAVAVTGLFVARPGADRLAAATAAATGDHRRFAERAHAAKRQVITTLFAHQLDQVTQLVSAASESAGRARTPELRAAVAELTTQLGVYRTYRVPGEPIRADDERAVTAAAERARVALAPEQASALADLLAVIIGSLEPGSAAADAVLAWQQLTSPATAKGVEDTALYDPGRLLAVADVGGDPDRGAVAVADFHAAMAERQRRTPLALSTLSTHDSKRSHDVRCRLAALSEKAEDWEDTVGRLEAARPVGEEVDAAERRYVYETLVGAWPLAGETVATSEGFGQRVSDYLTKSAREAKRRTSWVTPDTAHEEALTGFARDLLADPERRGLLAQLVQQLAAAAACNALASVAVRAIAPGVPDVYQNDDTWFLALVDPDNRTPLDVAAQTRLLDQLPEPGDERAAELLAHWRDGRIKQYVLRESLRLRRSRRRWFESAAYLPVAVTGRHAASVLAFARHASDELVVCVAAVRPGQVAASGDFPVGDVWEDTAVSVPEDCSLTDVLTGRRMAGGSVRLADSLRTLPVGVWLGRRGS